MNRAVSQPEVTRFTSRQAAKVIHDLRQARLSPEEKRADQRLRVVAAVSIGAMLVGLYVGDRIGQPVLMVASLVLGVLVFGSALWLASRKYKAGYQRFVLDHMADDGTFMFCPKCQALMGDPADAATRENPPRQCSECSSALWRFERPGSS
ncbi:MAG: hypothetical protein AAF333_06570 [Planctomycetota bacterium]